MQFNAVIEVLTVVKMSYPEDGHRMFSEKLESTNQSTLCLNSDEHQHHQLTFYQSYADVKRDRFKERTQTTG
jgi:hypothetical protein